MENGDRFPRIKRKNDRRYVSSSRYYGDTGSVGSAKYFIFDLASGFHQIPMHESDAQKTAFSTPHGHYRFN